MSTTKAVAIILLIMSGVSFLTGIEAIVMKIGAWLDLEYDIDKITTVVVVISAVLGIIFLSAGKIAKELI